MLRARAVAEEEYSKSLQRIANQSLLVATPPSPLSEDQGTAETTITFHESLQAIRADLLNKSVQVSGFVAIELHCPSPPPLICGPYFFASILLGGFAFKQQHSQFSKSLMAEVCDPLNEIRSHLVAQVRPEQSSRTNTFSTLF